MSIATTQSAVRWMGMGWELAKPKLVAMALLMTALGFIFGSTLAISWSAMAWTLLGSLFIFSGSATLNNYLERDVDALMNRTRRRALPEGRLSPGAALCYGCALIFGGGVVLTTQVSLLTASLALFAALLYVLVYTPLKRVYWWNTLVGTLPGALPPLVGWAAATGHLSWKAFLPVALLVAWQLPHFYAIAWLYKEDYRSGGLKMLAVEDVAGDRLVRQVMWSTFLLVQISLLPVWLGWLGSWYLFGAFVSGGVLFAFALEFVRLRAEPQARALLRATLVYLPVWVIAVVLDRKWS